MTIWIVSVNSVKFGYQSEKIFTVSLMMKILLKMNTDMLKMYGIHSGLDPCHYFSAPGLSWDAMSKMTKVNLELISEIDMQLFIEKGMRGGISYTAHCYDNDNN